MKGLVAIPGMAELAGAYEAIQSGAPLTVARIALWSQWARFDPRLAEQLVERLGLDWREIPPLKLRESILEQPWPQALALLLQQISDGGLIPPEERELFRQWRKLVVSGIGPASGELFFLGLGKFGGNRMLREASQSSRSYLRWGYFGRELLVNKAAMGLKGPAGRTLVSVAVRRAVLRELIRSRQRLTVREYREALGFRVSHRQAELDLAAERRLIPVGSTRGRFYRIQRRIKEGS